MGPIPHGGKHNDAPAFAPRSINMITNIWACVLLAGCAAATERPASRVDLSGLFAAVESAWQAEQLACPNIEATHSGRWITVRATAYSPHDTLDGEYHASKGARWRWITADGRTDVREQPYGVAVPRLDGRRPALPFGTRIIIPVGQGYLDQSRRDDRIFVVDDSGGAIRAKTIASGILHLDLRYRSEAAARTFGGALGWRELQVFVIADEPRAESIRAPDPIPAPGLLRSIRSD